MNMIKNKLVGAKVAMQNTNLDVLKESINKFTLKEFFKYDLRYQDPSDIIIKMIEEIKNNENLVKQFEEVFKRAKSMVVINISDHMLISLLIGITVQSKTYCENQDMENVIKELENHVILQEKERLNIFLVKMVIKAYIDQRLSQIDKLVNSNLGFNQILDLRSAYLTTNGKFNVSMLSKIEMILNEIHLSIIGHITDSCTNQRDDIDDKEFETISQICIYLERKNSNVVQSLDGLIIDIYDSIINESDIEEYNLDNVQDIIIETLRYEND